MMMMMSGGVVRWAVMLGGGFVLSRSYRQRWCWGVALTWIDFLVFD